MRRATGRGALAAVMLVALAAGCTAPAPDEAPAPPGTGERLMVTAGALQAGPVVDTSHARNPHEGNELGKAEGQRLFGWFNCAGCHGAVGGGGMGPPLRDSQWIYGSTPASIFQSIAQGRPNGMPAFGRLIPDEQIWKLELYIRSLGGVDTTVRGGGSSGRSPTQEQQARSGG